ncbi:ADP-dependent glucokinase [Macrosteles quadrilineatus]|uniref:ADP-dependent glucokinase n=1 Tax=Macrosteles quadrilineatus TaxID=74068 RepID=UPI0023E1C03E|nr:ADP-dependent glucokinase [Macrosteles quadrilineatus]
MLTSCLSGQLTSPRTTGNTLTPSVTCFYRTYIIMFQKFITVGTVFSVLFVLIAVYFNSSPENELNLRLKHVLQGLIDVESKFTSETPKVAVGYGACNDLFVEGKNFLQYDESVLAEYHEDINTLEELKRVFAFFFRHGAAAEQYVSNSTLFDELVAIASQMEGSRYSIGGNAPLMGHRMSIEGCEVLLAATLTPRLRLSLPSTLKVVGGVAERDDIHLILEYKAGDSWGPFTAPRANRFIIHNDDNNPVISSLEHFQEALKTFEADLLVISGLQMMDNYPFQQGEKLRRLLLVKQQMLSQTSQTRIHFEMASYTETELLEKLMDLIIPHSDSLGMNEQELANLVNLYQFGNVSIVSDSNPRVATVLDQMRQLLRLVRSSSSGKAGRRELTRIHVHTLAYQAILTTDSGLWPHSDIAAAKASLTAYRHVCATPQVDPDKAKLIMDDSFSVSRVSGSSDRVVLEPQRPVSCWTEDDLQLCVAPVLVCKESVQTAGGGDNISAAALAMQL